MPLRRRLSLSPPAAVALAAACYAAAELLLTVAFGRLFESGRAEAFFFFAWRPWLLILAAALAAQWRWLLRLAFYGSALFLASLGEAILLVRLGAAHPWPELLRGLAAGFLLLVPADLLIQAGRRLRGRTGVAAAVLAIGLLALVPALRQAHDAVAIGPGDAAPAGNKPVLLLLTSLPIVWGEGGAFDPASGPARAYLALQEEFEVRPLDTVDDAGLAPGRLLLVAQPRWLAPAELASLDGWVRRGGGALILVDPALAWPSELPLGDVRRPAPVSMLGPLLGHWGLRLEPARRSGLAVLQVDWPARRRLAMDSPGRFTASGKDCRMLSPAFLAGCSLDKGSALLVADADLLHDASWTAPGQGGDSRHARIADNPLFVADLLDRLAGLDRKRARRPVAWAESDADRGAALLLALLPASLAGAAGLLLLWLPGFRSQTYPQGYKA